MVTATKTWNYPGCLPIHRRFMRRYGRDFPCDRMEMARNAKWELAIQLPDGTERPATAEEVAYFLSQITKPVGVG